MVKIIMGRKGSGKTKKIIDLVRKAIDEDHGNVICIEKGMNLRFDIPYQARLIQASDYDFGDIEFLKGFISGLRSGNYDITHIFIDGVLKLIKDTSIRSIEEFLDWCEAFSEREKVKFTMTISEDVELATPGMKKYF